jgi:hypothetical protein
MLASHLGLAGRSEDIVRTPVARDVIPKTRTTSPILLLAKEEAVRNILKTK